MLSSYSYIGYLEEVMYISQIFSNFKQWNSSLSLPNFRPELLS